jgi:hypothetical protein
MIQLLTILLLASHVVTEQAYPDEMVRVTAPKVIAHPDENSVINVAIKVKNGYHIQAHEVTDEFIVPTTLEIKGDKQVVIKTIVFPSAKKFRLEGTDKDLDVYDGSFEIKAFFTAQKKIQRQIYQFNGYLKYQACDSMRCFSPKTIEFSIDVEVR